MYINIMKYLLKREMRQFFTDEERQEFAIWVSLLVSEYCKTQIYILLAFPMGLLYWH